MRVSVRAMGASGAMLRRPEGGRAAYPVGQILREDVALQVGSAAESVTVSAESSLLKTESGETAHDVTLKGASLGGGTAQADPGTIGVLRCDPAAIAEGAMRASGPQRAGDTITDHPRSGRDHGPELGAGSRRSGPACFDCAGGQLLRADQRAAQFGRQRTTRADFQAA